jgi:hypothetical protein
MTSAATAPTLLTLTQDSQLDANGVVIAGPCSCSCSGSVYVGVSRSLSGGKNELVILRGGEIERKAVSG